LRLPRVCWAVEQYRNDPRIAQGGWESQGDLDFPQKVLVAWREKRGEGGIGRGQEAVGRVREWETGWRVQKVHGMEKMGRMMGKKVLRGFAAKGYASFRSVSYAMEGVCHVQKK
jgi:hypothetical protein